ncbi:MAG: hypothetical protein HY864_09750 [Chloroflexi bacterium]|nr:hypothetical protein [Chloroflexota bacterium]
MTTNTINAHDITAEEFEIQRLLGRRITPEVIATFQIESRLNGWQYPTPGGGLRWKNFDSGATPKYQWLDGKSESAGSLYYADDLKDQIAMSGGVCWYVSGEPDVWAMRSALIPHVFSGFTEKVINPNFSDFLHSMGVKRLYIAPDLDETGAAFACKVAAALLGTGIELDCRQLPAELGEHGDIGKAWIKDNSQTPFIYYLLGLPRWYPEPEKPKVQTPLVVSTGEWSDIPADYRKKIMDACGVTKIKPDGFSNLVLCRIHNEEKPSAHFHETKGLYCFHEMKWYKWIEVGAVLGIEPFKQEKPTVILASPQLAVEAQRELIRLGFTALCRLLDELYQQGLAGGEVLTVKEIDATCPNLSPWTIRQAVKQAKGKGYFLREIPPSNAGRYGEGKTLKKSEKKKNSKSKGRPAKRIQVPDLTRLYAALNVQPETWQTDLPAYSRQNAAQYRAEVMAAKIRHKAGEYYIKQLTKPMGISPKTLRTYCKRANIEVTPRFDKRLMRTADDIQSLPEDARELAEWRREGKFKGAVWLETLDGKYKFAPTQEGAARAGRDGRAFRLVKQLANHYKASKP